MSILLLFAAGMAQAEAPAAATAFLTAVAASDLNAARATLGEEVMIRRGIETSADSSLEAFADHVRGCRRTELYWETDAEDRSRAAITVSWTCPGRSDARAFIWTAGPSVVYIQFE